MHPFETFAGMVALVIAAKTIAWLIQLRTRNAGIVDAIWSWSLGALAVMAAAFGTAPAMTCYVLAFMGGLWGIRLGSHLWQRNWGAPEDWRYARFRAQWGAFADIKMFFFFQFQNVFTLLLAASAFLPIAYRGENPAPPAIALAVAIWLISVIGEGVADAQMEAFRRNPANKGRVCREGFWYYTRHPNYFFECLHWLAYVPLALSPPGALSWGVVALIAPIVMAVLLMKLSGVPLLEAEMIRRKPGYADYVRTTNALIPWIPRS
jgi:steroid 5-alpha reductase family enzyme